MTTTENMFETNEPIHPHAPDSRQNQGQGGAVKGDRRSSPEETRSALDGSGLDQDPAEAGASDYWSGPNPFDGPRAGYEECWPVADPPCWTTNEPRPANSRQANPQAEADTEGEPTMTETSIPKGRGLFRVHRGDGQPVITNVRRLAGRELDTGSRLIAVATVCLAVLGAGLLAVSFAAQRQYVLSARHESWPSIIEALSLDIAMLIFALLGLGLAKKGLSGRTERAAVTICAAGSAFMNYLAADVASPRSVAAYVMPPLLLALAADRVIAVVRRWVLGQDVTEGSAWRTVGLGLAVGLVVLVKLPLYVLRIPLAPKETGMGLRQWVLNATPLPATPIEVTEGPEIEAEADTRTVGEILTDQGVILPGPGESKKDVLLKLYREHANYGNRELASKTATELAWRAELQPGTARSYIYGELGAMPAHVVAELARRTELPA